jgi:hypothetical protein
VRQTRAVLGGFNPYFSRGYKTPREIGEKMRVSLFGQEVSKDTLEITSYVVNIGTRFVLNINNVEINFDSLEDYENFVGSILNQFDKDRAEAKKFA